MATTTWEQLEAKYGATASDNSQVTETLTTLAPLLGGVVVIMGMLYMLRSKENLTMAELVGPLSRNGVITTGTYILTTLVVQCLLVKSKLNIMNSKPAARVVGMSLSVAIANLSQKLLIAYHPKMFDAKDKFEFGDVVGAALGSLIAAHLSPD